MHESRTFPRFLPRLNKSVEVHFGDPINHVVDPLLASYHEQGLPIRWKPETYERDVGEDIGAEPDSLTRARSELAEVLRGELMRVGREARTKEEV